MSDEIMGGFPSEEERKRKFYRLFFPLKGTGKINY